MDRDRVIERIWRKDHTVWKDDPTEITDRLGWLTVSDLMRERLPELQAFATQAAADGFETAVLLGMGGSSLAPEVFMTTFGAADGALELIVLDTTHPATIERVTGSLELAKTLFVVASKSGTTTETLSHFAYFWEPDPERRAVRRDHGPGDTARAHGARARVPRGLPQPRGHRRALLGALVLRPRAGGADRCAAARGARRGRGDAVRVRTHRAGRAEPGREARRRCWARRPRRAGTSSRSSCREEIASFGGWVEQLIAESTGKEGVGIVPVVGEPLGPPDVYGDDRLFVAIGEHEGLDAFERLGHPVVRIGLEDREQLGGEFFRWEMATAVAGYVLGINPFDQPNVQEAKDATKEILAAGSVEDPGTDDLRALLKEIGPGDYVAILAYLDRTSETEDTIERARLAIRDRYAVATTTGFGPRFLHSTGQLHKGGPDSGVFIQITDGERATDLPIPGQPFSFGTLIDAQALGDLRSLRTRGRRVARVRLEQLTEVI